MAPSPLRRVLAKAGAGRGRGLSVVSDSPPLRTLARRSRHDFAKTPKNMKRASRAGAQVNTTVSQEGARGRCQHQSHHDLPRISRACKYPSSGLPICPTAPAHCRGPGLAHRGGGANRTTRQPPPRPPQGLLLLQGKFMQLGTPQGLRSSGDSKSPQTALSPRTTTPTPQLPRGSPSGLFQAPGSASNCPLGRGLT